MSWLVVNGGRLRRLYNLLFAHELGWIVAPSAILTLYEVAGQKIRPATAEKV